MFCTNFSEKTNAWLYEGEGKAAMQHSTAADYQSGCPIQVNMDSDDHMMEDMACSPCEICMYSEND